MNELRKAMRQAGCSSEFILFATRLLREHVIIWDDTKIEATWISVRVEDGYRMVEIYD